MKKTILSIFVLLLSASHAFSQNLELQTYFKTYLQIKDALVLNQISLAGNAATEMLKSLEKAPKFSEKENMTTALKNIASSNAIEAQRNALSTLTTELWKLIKSSKGLTQVVYYQYCPMKKMAWLSSESQIRNPYYGEKMLTCGTIKEIKPKLK